MSKVGKEEGGALQEQPREEGRGGEHGGKKR